MANKFQAERQLTGNTILATGGTAFGWITICASHRRTVQAIPVILPSWGARSAGHGQQTGWARWASSDPHQRNGREWPVGLPTTTGNKQSAVHGHIQEHKHFQEAIAAGRLGLNLPTSAACMTIQRRQRQIVEFQLYVKLIAIRVPLVLRNRW
ncbi:hypothetical protein B7463_g10979, partial [Scytalidium lignicola]